MISEYSFLPKFQFQEIFYKATDGAAKQFANSPPMGHRRSLDLHVFSETDEVHARLRQELIHSFSACHAQVIENVDGNLFLLVYGQYAGFPVTGFRCLNQFR